MRAPLPRAGTQGVDTGAGSDANRHLSLVISARARERSDALRDGALAMTRSYARSAGARSEEAARGRLSVDLKHAEQFVKFLGASGGFVIL